jgi:uncharacterized membrane protein
MREAPVTVTTSMPARVRAADRRHRDGRAPRGVVAAGLMLGLGLGGFVDGIVLHQILQWHHMLTDYGRYAAFPDVTVALLEENTLWDGLFHASTWVLVAAGVVVLWRASSRGEGATGRQLLGLMLAGWGTFNLVEGVVDHHLLTLHHVRDDVADPLWWDLGFLALGAVLVLTGVCLYSRSRRTTVDFGSRR